MDTKIFDSGHFLISLLISWIEKMPRAKKVVNIKNQFLHAHQPRKRIFDIRSHRCRIFTITCQSFKWLPLLQFWELVSKNEILRTISCIYFMKIRVDSWFSGTKLVLISSNFLDSIKTISNYVNTKKMKPNIKNFEINDPGTRSKKGPDNLP